MASLQFIGIDQIVKAFEYRAAELWAIFDGKRMIHKGEGSNALREFLDMIGDSGTTATYILKVFDDLEDAKQIKSNTPDDGSFSFKLHQYDAARSESGIVRRHYGDPVLAEISGRLGAIEERILADKPIEDDEDETGFGEQLQTAVLGMIQDPNKLKNFLDIFRSQAPTGGALTGPYRAASVGATATPNGSGSPAAPTLGGQPLTAETVQKIGDLIETLARHDPRIVEHLEKLANLAEKSPRKFSSILAIFDTTM